MLCRKCSKEICDGSAYCSFCGAKQTLTARPARKRGNSQGNAYRRGKTWTARWTVETYADPETQSYHIRRQTKGGFATKTLALAYAANPPRKTEPKAPTLRHYYDVFKAGDYLDLGKSKQCAMRIAWGKMADLAGLRMDAITIDMLQSCVDTNATTYYPAKDMRTLFSHLFKRAVAEGNARTNLSTFIHLPPLNEKELQPFTEDEIRKIWKAYSDGDTFGGYLLIMIYTGMMPGELFLFRRDQVDYEKNEIVGCGLKTSKRKSTAIVFPNFLSPTLQEIVSRSQSKRGYVLDINRDRFYSEYHLFTARAGIRDLPPYSCRHTTATALALGNVAPTTIKEVMRHTKFSTTQRYIHPDSATAVAAVNTLSIPGQDPAPKKDA